MKNRTRSKKFPMKLFSVLEEASADSQLSKILSWLPCGKAFKIHDPFAFKEIILPLHFSGMSSYRSFRRQLNLYQIRKQVKTLDLDAWADDLSPNERQDIIGGYYHPLFQRNQNDLVAMMPCIKRNIHCTSVVQDVPSSMGRELFSLDPYEETKAIKLAELTSSERSTGLRSIDEEKHPDQMGRLERVEGDFPTPLPSSLSSHPTSLLNAVVHSSERHLIFGAATIGSSRSNLPDQLFDIDIDFGSDGDGQQGDLDVDNEDIQTEILKTFL